MSKLKCEGGINNKVLPCSMLHGAIGNQRMGCQGSLLRRYHVICYMVIGVRKLTLKLKIYWWGEDLT